MASRCFTAQFALNPMSWYLVNSQVVVLPTSVLQSPASCPKATSILTPTTGLPTRPESAPSFRPRTGIAGAKREAQLEFLPVPEQKGLACVYAGHCTGSIA